MILKQTDPIDLTDLERLAALPGDIGKRAKTELRNRKAGISGEKEACYLMDFDLEKLRNTVVIHDLRLETGGRTAQIDHLLINRHLDVTVVETKRLHAGIKISDGEFLAWDAFRKTYRRMDSPMEQNRRHIEVLRDAFDDIPMPVRLGIRLAPTFHSWIATSKNARIIKPKKDKRYDQVVPIDRFVRAYLDAFDKESTLAMAVSMTKRVSRETLYEIAEDLVALHVPAPKTDWAKRFGLDTTQDLPEKGIKRTKKEPDTQACRLACKQCGGSEGLQPKHGRFGYYVTCPCGANTSMNVECSQCGGKTRVKKVGDGYFATCQGCGDRRIILRE